MERKNISFTLENANVKNNLKDLKETIRNWQVRVYLH